MTEFLRKEARSAAPRPAPARVMHTPAAFAAQGLDFGIIDTSGDRPRPRYGIEAADQPAELPPAIDDMAGSSAQQGGWMTAILGDSTLRHGDVVMFPEGPKVFRGQADFPPWREADFVDVSQARGLSETNRRSLLALVGRAELLPDDASKVRVTIRQGSTR